MSRPGLRSRVTLLLAAGALLLSAALAVVTYQLTSRHLLAERERTAVRGAYFDAAVVQQGLSGEDADVVAVLRSLDTGQSRRPLLRRDGKWFARTADDGLTTAIPHALQALVEDNNPAVQRISISGQPLLVVGVPLNRPGEDFYEIQSLSEVQATLRTTSSTLLLVAIGATLAAAALSRWVSGLALRPLREVTRAATGISHGDLTVRIAAAHDPDLDALTDAFNAMVREVSERIERDQRFAADVSHELRSPLQTLTAASSVLLRNAEHLDDRSAAAARLVADEIERFAALVQGLLVLARSHTAPQLVETDVVDLIRRACHRSGIDPQLAEVPAALTWTVDPARLEQVLVNLLDNAQRHGGGVARVTATALDEQLVLTVDDAGPGVPTDERGIIFDRFSRGRAAHSRGDSDGTGLGLALVAQHVGAHNGEVEILDRPGGGARFRVTLPAEGRV